MAHLTQEDLDDIAARLNSRPQKTLDFDTPAHRLQQLLRCPIDSIEAVFRISLACRNSRFSNSRTFKRWASSVVTPARRPLSTSKRRTHLRTVSGVGPNFSAALVIAAHYEPQCCSASKTIRTARSRNSTG